MKLWSTDYNADNGCEPCQNQVQNTSIRMHIKVPRFKMHMTRHQNWFLHSDRLAKLPYCAMLVTGNGEASKQKRVHFCIYLFIYGKKVYEFRVLL